MPETSKVHKVESAHREKAKLATGDDSKIEKASFMSQNNQVRVEDSPDLELKHAEFVEEAPDIAKERRPVNGQTGSTMNIKSYSGYDSAKHSVNKEELMSPEVEIQNIDIPGVYNQERDTEDTLQHKRGASAMEERALDFEKNMYRTAENYREFENPVYRQSNNSTMLMESIKDHQISGIWGKLTRKR